MTVAYPCSGGRQVHGQGTIRTISEDGTPDEKRERENEIN